jgi:hypothetical protein
VGVGHLVRGDAVHEDKKRPVRVGVTGQDLEHRETHLLDDVIRRGERLVVAADAGTAVSHHERTDPTEHTLNGGKTHHDPHDHDPEQEVLTQTRVITALRYLTAVRLDRQVAGVGASAAVAEQYGGDHETWLETLAGCSRCCDDPRW